MRILRLFQHDGGHGEGGTYFLSPFHPTTFHLISPSILPSSQVLRQTNDDATAIEEFLGLTTRISPSNIHTTRHDRRRRRLFQFVCLFCFFHDTTCKKIEGRKPTAEISYLFIYLLNPPRCSHCLPLPPHCRRLRWRKLNNESILDLSPPLSISYSK